ncbi:MAG: hexitol phosphatase HxpB [Actinomycetota bacterium]
MSPTDHGEKAPTGTALRAVVFDMDGLIIDSEPLWREAEKEIFGSIGVILTDEMCVSTMGLRIDEVVAHWHRLFPWEGPTKEEVATRVVDRVISLVREKGAALPGARTALANCRSVGLRTALASSSARRIITAALNRLGVSDGFEVILSAQDEPAGKPDPAIYLSAAAALGVTPDQCLALEDSLNGVLAAKAAGMICIAIPSGPLAYPADAPRADLTLTSLEEISTQLLEEFAVSLTR